MGDNDWTLDTFAQIRYRVLGFTGVHCQYESPTYSFFRQQLSAGADMWRASEIRCCFVKSKRASDEIVVRTQPPTPVLTKTQPPAMRPSPLELPLLDYLVHCRIRFKHAMCKNRVHTNIEERSMCAHSTNDAHAPAELLAQFNCQVVIDYYAHHLGREIVPTNVRDTKFRCAKCCCARLTCLFPWVQTHDEVTRRLISPLVNIYCVQCRSTSTLSVY